MNTSETIGEGEKMAKSTAALLCYQALVAPDTILLKDGSLLAGFRYMGNDLTTVPMRERAVVAHHVSTAIKNFGNGYAFHFEAIRVPATAYPHGQFSETVTKLIDRERQNLFKQKSSHYETCTYCFVTWKPQDLADIAAGKVMSLFRKKEDKTDAIISEQRIAAFQDKIKNLRNSLALVFATEQLKEAKFLSALSLCVNGIATPEKAMPENIWTLDTLLARDIENGYPLLYNNEYTAVISIDGLPHDSLPSMLADLGQLPFGYRWSSRYIPFDFNNAYARMTKEQKKWAQKALPLMAQIFERETTRVNKDALMQEEDVNEALTLLHQGDASFGHYTGTVIIRSEDYETLNRQVHETVRCLNEILFSVKIERRNALEAFIGSLPGHTYENIRKPVIHSLNLAHFLLLSSPWPGQVYNPCSFYPSKSPALIQCASTGGNPFRLHLHVSDVGHTLILGPTGSGKSTLLATIAAQFDRYEGSQIFIFDKGRSMFSLAAAMKNSSFYELGDDEAPISLCPLSILENTSDITWANEYVENLVLLNDGIMTPERRREISNTIKAMAAGTNSEDRSLTYLHIAIQDEHLKNVLEAYTTKGPFGKYLDGTTTNIQYSKTTVFELEELMRRGEKITTPTLLYLFHEIGKRLNGRPTLIIIDEAWLVMANKLFAQQLTEWLKVLRKANAAVVLATQNLTDVINSNISSVIIDSCPTKILLPNQEAKSEVMKKLYHDQLRITETEIDTIASAVQKQDYFYISSLGRRLFSLSLGPVQLAFVGSAGKEDIRKIKALKKQHGEEWPFYWLQEKGLSKWAEYWSELERGESNDI